MNFVQRNPQKLKEIASVLTPDGKGGVRVVRIAGMTQERVNKISGGKLI